MTIGDNPKSVLFGSDFGGADISSHIDLVDGLDITHSLKEKIYSQNIMDVFNLSLASLG